MSKSAHQQDHLVMPQNQPLGDSAVLIEATAERLIPGFAPRWEWHHHLSRYLFALSFVGGKSVFDCACGVGYGAYLLAANGASQVVGCDIAKDAVKYATVAYHRPNLRFILADAHDLPFESFNSRFDVVVSFETLEHMLQPERFIANVPRLLSAKGVFLASVPNREALPIGVSSFSPYHIREFAPWEFENLLLGYFTDVQLLYQTWPDMRVVLRRSVDNAIPWIMRRQIRVLQYGIHAVGRIANALLPMPNFTPQPYEMNDRLTEIACVIIAVCSGPR
jgi:SAM-dependent methyltransferase